MKENLQEAVRRNLEILRYDVTYTIPNLVIQIASRLRFSPAKQYIHRKELEHEAREARLRAFWITTATEPIPIISSFEELHNMSNQDFEVLLRNYIVQKLETSKQRGASEFMCSPSVPHFVEEQS